MLLLTFLPVYFQALVRTRSLQIRCVEHKASVKHLNKLQDSDGDRIAEYKEAMHNLNIEINTQRARISELEKSACQVDELTKETPT